MDIGSLFLILALAVAVGLFVSEPFFESPNRKSSPAQEAAEAREHTRSTLLADEERVLDTLQELDFDNSLGKIPASEYQAQRSSLLKQGADIMCELDRFAEQSEISSAEDRLEKMIADRRAQASANSIGAGANNIGAGVNNIGAGTNNIGAGTDNVGAGTNNIGAGDAIEDQIAVRRRSRDEKSVGFCPKCGHPLQKSDRFCPKCGLAL